MTSGGGRVGLDAHLVILVAHNGGRQATEVDMPLNTHPGGGTAQTFGGDREGFVFWWKQAAEGKLNISPGKATTSTRCG